MNTTTALHPAPTRADGLAQNAEKAKDGCGPLETAFPAPRYVGEPKLDGWRLLVHRDKDGVHLYTRTAKSHDGSLPEIEAEIMDRFPAGTWLDCEAVALQVEDGKIVHDWNTVQSVLGSGTAKAAAKSGSISLMVFDLIAHGGTDARLLPLARRRELLEDIFEEGAWGRVLLVPQLQPTDAGLEALLAQGFEGMVIKDRTARYASGKRGQGWTKIKPQDTEDVVIMGFKAGENGFTGMVGAIIFGQYRDGELTERGRASGMDMRTRKAMTEKPEDWIGQVVEVAHMGVMDSGNFRHPQTKRRRTDKAPTDCTWS